MEDLLSLQFEVFRNPGRRERDIPFVVVLQSDTVFQTSSVLVAPLVPTSSVSPSRLFPLFRVDGSDWALIVTDMAAIPRTRMTDRVTSLTAERHRIVGALDLLFTGI